MISTITVIMTTAGPAPGSGSSSTTAMGGLCHGSANRANHHLSDAVEWPRPNDPHPDWVGYLPTTTWHVPANSTIEVQIDQEDGASGLRNPFWGKAFGIEGGKMHVKYFDDQGNPKEDDMSSIDPTMASHTFAIPDLGVFVPLLAVGDNAAPGTQNIITFSFKTKGPGVYRWQCFVPCAAGTFLGTGGPMSTFGYMGGQLIVGSGWA